MRVFLFLFIVGIASQVSADDPLKVRDEATPKSVWHQPFETISASDASRTLVLMLITNDDPFVASESGDAATSDAAENQNQADTTKPALWCTDLLESSLSEAIARRKDLVGRIQLQAIAVGMPKILTGGESTNAPARAILALCDGNYRLLSFVVGVPDEHDLLTLIEDGEDTATLLQLHARERSLVTERIVQRSKTRLGRMWNAVLDDVALERQSEEDEEGSEAVTSLPTIGLLAEDLEPTYIADVGLRFGLTGSEDSSLIQSPQSAWKDRKRLIVLEQHIETRQPWCDAMVPFITGCDFSAVWRDLVESTWGHPPVTADADAEELIAWFDLQIESGAVVLSLTKPPHLRRVHSPTIGGGKSQVGLGWQEVHALALEHPYRTITPESLAVLMRKRDMRPINLHRPTAARYLYIQPEKQRPTVIRVGDSPGRFAGVLKKSKSKLVSK